MTPYQLHHSTTGAAKAQFSAPLGGKPTVFLHVPVGAGRRLRLEIGVGQAVAVYEALGLALADVERHFGPKERA